jgi:hypothetical protein
MASKKIKRSLNFVGLSQITIEKTSADKFAAVQDLAQSSVQIETLAGRVNPQLSCTVEPEEKDIRMSLALYANNKGVRLLTTSAIIRSLIRLGSKYKQELEF